ncbi:MAG: STAS domain-containing protein [Magnetococcales bacterium]|nr:STAS domain-containing protein [Magnetococcales bacterium]
MEDTPDGRRLQTDRRARERALAEERRRDADRRSHKSRAFCGLLVHFNQCVGNALEVSDDSVFIVFGSPCAAEVGQKGRLQIHLLDGQVAEEEAIVSRVTEVGIAVVSLEEESVLPSLEHSIRNGIKWIDHRGSQTVVHFKGDLTADCLNDFSKIFVGKEPGRKYVLDFTNVSTIAHSGLAMLLQLASYNKGNKEDIRIINSNKEVLKTLSMLDVPEIAITVSRQREVLSGTAHQFKVTAEEKPEGGSRVVVQMAEMFDYNCRHEFLQVYQGRPKHTDYVLDFKETLFVGKAALGTMLLLKQHNGADDTKRIKLVNCSPSVKRMFEMVDFGRFFEIT